MNHTSQLEQALSEDTGKAARILDMVKTDISDKMHNERLTMRSHWRERYTALREIRDIIAKAEEMELD